MFISPTWTELHRVRQIGLVYCCMIRAVNQRRLGTRHTESETHLACRIQWALAPTAARYTVTDRVSLQLISKQTTTGDAVLGAIPVLAVAPTAACRITGAAASAAAAAGGRKMCARARASLPFGFLGSTTWTFQSQIHVGHAFSKFLHVRSVGLVRDRCAISGRWWILTRT